MEVIETMEPTSGLEPLTCRLRILGSDVLRRAFNGLGWCPMLQSDAMLRHSTVFGHQFGH